MFRLFSYKKEKHESVEAAEEWHLHAEGVHMQAEAVMAELESLQVCC